MKLSPQTLKQLIKEELEVILTDDEAAELFGEQIRHIIDEVTEIPPPPGPISPRLAAMLGRDAAEAAEAEAAKKAAAKAANTAAAARSRGLATPEWVAGRGKTMVDLSHELGYTPEEAFRGNRGVFNASVNLILNSPVFGPSTSHCCLL